MKLLCISIGSLILWSGCENQSTFEPVKTNHLSISRVFPNPANPGDILVVEGTDFEPNYMLNSLRFGTRYLRIDSGNVSHIWVRLPFWEEYAQLTLFARNDSVAGPILDISRQCPSLVCLTSTPAPVTSLSSSSVTDCLGQTVLWTAMRSADSILISQSYCSGDDSRIEKRIRFLVQAPMYFPEYIDGFVDHFEIQSQRTDTLKGYITIDRDPGSGIISGRVSTFVDTDQTWWDFDFYCEIP